VQFTRLPKTSIAEKDMIENRAVNSGHGNYGLSASNTKHVWAARLVILVAFLDLFMQFPIIAPYARSLGAPGVLIGVIVAAYSATNLIGNLVAGVVLDRWGRRIPILVGLMSSAIILLGYLVARTPGQLLIIRSLHGLATSSLNPGAFAILGDSTPDDRRARVMGVSGAVIAISAIIGPAIAGILGDRVNPGAVFVLSSSLMLIASGCFWFLFKGQYGRNLKTSTPGIANAVSPWLFMRRRSLVIAYITTLALTIGLGTLVTHLPVIMSVNGESASGRGLVFSVFAVVAMVFMAGPLNRVSDRYGRLGPAAIGLGLCGAGMLLMSVFNGMYYTLAGMGLFGAGFGILFPSMSSLVAEVSKPDERGKAFGVFYAIFSLGVVAGSVASGALAQHFGETTGAPFFMAAIVVLVTIIVTRIREPIVAKTEEMT